MVSLESKLYSVGEVIISSSQTVNKVVFIIQGTCSLAGYCLNKETKELMRFELVTLFEGSWYGDHQVLIGTDSAYELSVKTPTVKALNRIAEDQAMIFEVNGQKLRRIC